MNYNIFFNNFINKLILVNKIKKPIFLNLKNERQDLSSKDKKLKRKKYYFSFNKRKSKTVIRKDNYFIEKFIMTI